MTAAKTEYLYLWDPFHHPRVGGQRDLRYPCSHGTPPPEECQWCEGRAPGQILSAAVYHALNHLGLVMMLGRPDGMWHCRDAEGRLHAAAHTTHPEVSEVPKVTAPPDHPFWAVLRAYCAERAFDPEYWITEGDPPGGFRYW